MNGISTSLVNSVFTIEGTCRIVKKHFNFLWLNGSIPRIKKLLIKLQQVFLQPVAEFSGSALVLWKIDIAAKIKCPAW
jgi:hypothetical protein